MQQVSVTQVREFNAVMRGVYNWMTLGLALTAGVAYLVASTPSLVQTIFSNQLLFFGLIIGEFALVFYLAARITKLAPSTAAGLFLLYSALNGVTLSIVLLAYTASDVSQAFIVTAATFGAMSIYGYVTKRDLSGMGSFLTMGVIGLVIAMVVNMFVRSTQMEMIISVIGVLIFTALTAYDTQKIKVMSQTIAGQGEYAAGRVKVYGALNLYLDFINLFLFMLRFMGGSRD